jgi:hypothetical protein
MGHSGHQIWHLFVQNVQTQYILKLKSFLILYLVQDTATISNWNAIILCGNVCMDISIDTGEDYYISIYNLNHFCNYISYSGTSCLEKKLRHYRCTNSPLHKTQFLLSWQKLQFSRSYLDVNLDVRTLSVTLQN